jgi:magnesium transporter
MVVAYCHSQGSGWSAVEDLATVSDLRSETGRLLWAEADAAAIEGGDIETLATELELDAHELEEARSRSRPKLDVHDEHFLLVVHQLDEIGGQLEASQLSCFVGDSYLLTIHEGAGRTLGEAKERWANPRRDLGGGPAYLVYTLLDVVVDDYERIVADLEDEIEQLEETTLETPEAPIQRQLYAVKQRIARLRRYALPVNRMLDQLDDPQDELQWPPATLALFREVHDHMLRIAEEVGSIDDISQAVLELKRSEQTTKLSDINKKLTAWAAIVAVPTFIASVYGMNFALLPATGSSLGFWFAIVAMATAAGWLYALFKTKNWL